MTLNDIIVAALSQLDRSHDSQTIGAWRDKMTRFANEAVTDLARTLRLRRSDQATVENGQLDTDALPRHCLKVLSLWQGEQRIPFLMGVSSTKLRPICSDGPITITYEYLPTDMSSPTDVPELPEWCHGLIVTYVVGRERATSDPSTQRGANIYFEIYHAAKRGMRTGLGEADRYRLENQW